ncbi:uncharacterized protein LOC132933098 [Metopolophium dirhodum]|uniref:uncharacterized protein LOC132933098 n=1 Tax=Metopolophium dirhodum TaxID=44670 RepID=UPI00298F6E44|nr:uncharacterized protein LOC132933098 [Metopolophium dirhodum]
MKHKFDRNPDAALVYSWPTAESSIRQSRRSVCPAVPSTLRELGEYLDMNTDRYQCNYNFYQEWIVDNDGKYSVMFTFQEIISAVVHQGATELHADATFKVVPSMPHCRQLFMLHLILQNHSVPVCFVLMEVKTEAAYRKVLERFSRKFPEVRPLTITIDFETALRNVFSDVYPEATVSSCWFHFVQSLLKNIKKMGYSNHVQQHREAKMCLRMCAVLALLPAHQIEQGFQDIKMHAQNNSVLIPRFFTYFTSFWLTRKGPESFSVYNQPRRTNNNVESFHSNLKQTFQVSHPNLWRMLDHLKNISIKQHIVINQLAAGMATTRNTKFKFILNSLRIKHATALLATGAITIKEFLLQCSHCVDGYLTRELNWHDATDVTNNTVEKHHDIALQSSGYQIKVHRYISIIVKRCDAGIYLQDINKSDIEQHKVTQPTGIDSININKSDDQNSDDDDDDDDSSDCTNDNESIATFPSL